MTRRSLNYLAVVFGMCALGCAAKEGFNRGQMETRLLTANPIYVSSGLSVEEIEKLKPQVTLPIRLAVAPLYYPSYVRGDHQEDDSWTPEELTEIESWEKPLKDANIVSDLIILPKMLLEPCGEKVVACRSSSNRAAAARVQADALLTINMVTGVDEYTNLSSLFDVLIIGMWLAPGHHRDALTLAEGAMVDNRNGYLYAFARGEGEEDIVRPFIYADSWKAARPSRLKALKAFGAEFVKQASKLSTR